MWVAMAARRLRAFLQNFLYRTPSKRCYVKHARHEPGALATHVGICVRARPTRVPTAIVLVAAQQGDGERAEQEAEAHGGER